MTRIGVLPAWLLAIPLAMTVVAQPQVGGGTCNSGTLTGTYSLTLTGRDLSSSTTFNNVEQGVGTATFDGLSAVTFNLTNNTNKALGVVEKLSGTYSLQTNCLGTINITSGDTATFTLGAFSLGSAYFISGQDGQFALSGNGNAVPTAACTTGTFNGTYSFNGNGYVLNAGAIVGGNYISGLAVFDGAGNVSTNAYVSINGSTTQITTKGTYTVTPGCTATATYTDSSGGTYSVNYTITSANGAFVATIGTPNAILSVSGRIL
jgi:hypothetical protein